MEAIILIGIQASGKSSFYRQHFVDSHVHVILDALRSRREEIRLLRACFTAGRPIVSAISAPPGPPASPRSATSSSPGRPNRSGAMPAAIAACPTRRSW